MKHPEGLPGIIDRPGALFRQCKTAGLGQPSRSSPNSSAVLFTRCSKKASSPGSVTRSVVGILSITWSRVDGGEAEDSRTCAKSAIYAGPLAECVDDARTLPSAPPI